MHSWVKYVLITICMNKTYEGKKYEMEKCENIKILNKSRHESLLIEPVIIPKILFFNLKTLFL
jgi:hypothetical protein